MSTVGDTVCRYVCGGCGYDRTAPWWEHQAHYESHFIEGVWNERSLFMNAPVPS